MRVFNIHGHVASPTLDEMDEVGIERSIALAGKGQNEQAFELAAESGGRIIPFVFPGKGAPRASSSSP